VFSRLISRLAVALLIAFPVGGCTSPNSGPAAQVQRTVSATGTAAPKRLFTPAGTSTPEPKPSATSTPTRHAINTASPSVSSIVTEVSDKPRLVATPVAVDQLAVATLTVAAARVASPLSTPDQTTTAVRPSPSPAITPGLRYVFPIRPPDVASYSASHHDYPATDIFAPYRSEYIAVTDGTIEELSRIDQWDPATDDPAVRGGRYVSLIGDDGVRYYGSHLDEVAAGLEVGMHVTAGTVLGYVGNSGNARGIAPHLHFGISPPTFPGDWQVRRGAVWPYKYLQAWARGEAVTPEIP
jgi:murein DD-endopeptidase MepM/ murein hydrolase activator NlpD